MPTREWRPELRYLLVRALHRILKAIKNDTYIYEFAIAGETTHAVIWEQRTGPRSCVHEQLCRQKQIAQENEFRERYESVQGAGKNIMVLFLVSPFLHFIHLSMYKIKTTIKLSKAPQHTSGTISK